MASCISLYYKVSISSITVILSHCFSKYTIIYHCKFEENLISSYEDMTHETHTIIFTNSRKRAIGFTPGVFQGVYFLVFISFGYYFGIIIKEKCIPFNQGIIQQPIMPIYKVITPMTELSDSPSYVKTKVQISFPVICTFAFTTRLVQSLVFLKFPASSHLLCFCSLVYVRPVQKPGLLVFSRRGSPKATESKYHILIYQISIYHMTSKLRKRHM